MTPRSPSGFLASCCKAGIPKATAEEVLAKQEANLLAFATGFLTYAEVQTANRGLVRRALAVRDLRRASAS